jgi:hypothetical protein
MNIDSIEHAKSKGKVTASYTLPRSEIVLDRAKLMTFNEKLQTKLLKILSSKGFRFRSGVHPLLSAPNISKNDQSLILRTFQIELAGNQGELPPVNILEEALKEAIRFAQNAMHAVEKPNDSATE